MIEATDVSFAVRGKPIVQGVSLQVLPGEILAVVGPNGAGKSTLLRLLTGELKPTTGQIHLEQKPLREWTRLALAQRRAVLLQRSSLSFAFTALEVVSMGRIPHHRGAESARDQAIAAQALASVGLGGFADRLYPTLSGGEQQRVQLARILAQIWEPPDDGARYLLLDEPTSSLDLAYQQQTLRLAQSFAAAGTAVFVILHDLNLAAQYASRILMLKAGQAHACGTPGQVLRAETIEQVFETPVLVLEHPQAGVPLVTPLASERGEGLPTLREIGQA